jgi:hypothetical protein
VTVKSYVRAKCSEAVVTACLLEVSTMQGETYVFNVVPRVVCPSALSPSGHAHQLMCKTTHDTQKEEMLESIYEAVEWDDQGQISRIEVLCFTPASPPETSSQLALRRSWTYTRAYKRSPLCDDRGGGGMVGG